jgi:hypothetical protein
MSNSFRLAWPVVMEYPETQPLLTYRFINYLVCLRPCR